VVGAALGVVVVWALFLVTYHLEASEHRHALRQVQPVLGFAVPCCAVMRPAWRAGSVAR
jgi:hypothetical protein